MRNKHYVCLMRKHNGMRPQDIAILLKVIELGNENIQLSQLSNALSISISEISESLNRSQLANLIDYNKKNVYRQNLFEFLEHGVRYVFPQAPGSMVRGIATAHSHPFLKKYFDADIDYVWYDVNGETIGLQIEPLYSKQVNAVKESTLFYEMLALVDTIRVGRVREVELALKQLKNIILNESYQYSPNQSS